MRITKKKISTLIFYIAYSMLLFSIMFSNVHYINKFINTIENIGLLILILNIFIQDIKYPKKSMLLIIILTIPVLISSLICNERVILKLILLIISSKQLDFNRFIKYDLIIRIIFLFLVLFLYKINLTTIIEIYRSDGTFRNSMGFIHPNTFGTIVFVICCEVTYLCKNRKNIIYYATMLLLSIMIEKVADSRTSQIGIILLMIFNFIDDFMPTNLKFKMYKIIKYVPLILITLSFIISFAYANGNKLAIELDKLLSKRIYYSYAFIEEYGLKPFGTTVEFIYNNFDQSKELWVLDNAYLLLMIRYGIIVSIMFILGLYSIIKKLLKEENNSKLIIIFAIYFIISFIETSIFKIQYNPFLVYFSVLLYNVLYIKKKGLKDERKKMC